MFGKVCNPKRGLIFKSFLSKDKDLFSQKSRKGFQRVCNSKFFRKRASAWLQMRKGRQTGGPNVEPRDCSALHLCLGTEAPPEYNHELSPPTVRGTPRTGPADLRAWQQSLEGRGIGLAIVEQLSWGGGLLQSRGLARVGATRQRDGLTSSD